MAKPNISSKIFLISALFAMASLLAACGQGSSSNTTASAPKSSSSASSSTPSSSLAPSASSAKTTNSGKLTTINIVLSHYPTLLEYAPYFVAMKKGWFKQAGIKLSINSGGGGGDTMRTLSTGGIDIAMGGAAAALLEAKTDPNVELVAGFQDINDNAWLVPKNSKVHSIKDLAGSKLGYSHAGSASEFTVKEVVRLAKIPNVTFVSCGGFGSCLTAAQSGAITAGWSVEPLTPIEVKKGYRVAFYCAKYLPNYIQDFFDVNTHWANTHQTTLKNFFAVVQKGIDYVNNQRSQAVAITAQDLKQPTWAVKQGLDYWYSISPTPWSLNPPAKGINTLQQGMIANGQLKKQVNFSQIINTEFLPPGAK